MYVTIHYSRYFDWGLIVEVLSGQCSMGLQFCAIAVIKLLCPQGRKLLMPLSLFPNVTNLKAWKRSFRFLVPDIVEKGLVKFSSSTQ